MSEFIIKEITSSQLNAYKTFLKTGLLQDSDNFRISPNDDETAPFPTKDQSDSFTLGAFSNQILVGVVCFTRDGDNREKLRHKGILFRLYVAKEFRGKGIASLLIESVIEKVKALGTIEHINLTVIANNARAKKMYERFGFVTFASEPQAVKWNGEYFTEDHMKLKLV
ncbi:GNAT family N-acetyltransferase [bacterium]|nr:MAG: GNAT family N-acetyltransferase [bacterium]